MLSFWRGVKSSSIEGLPKFTLSLVEIDKVGDDAVLLMCITRSEVEDEEDAGGRVVGSVTMGTDATVEVWSSDPKWSSRACLFTCMRIGKFSVMKIGSWGGGGVGGEGGATGGEDLREGALEALALVLALGVGLDLRPMDLVGSCVTGVVLCVAWGGGAK